MHITVNTAHFKKVLQKLAEAKNIGVLQQNFDVRVHVIRQVGDFMLAKIFVGYFGGLDGESIWFEQSFIVGSPFDDRNWKLRFVKNCVGNKDEGNEVENDN